MPLSPAEPPPLVGRDDVLARLDELLAAGGTLAVTGERGSGRSVVLATAATRAGARGAIVLRTVGAEAERDLPYAALHQLLRPIRRHLDALPGPRRAALDAVFGHADPAAAPAAQVCLGTFELLRCAAAEAPVLVVADATEWLDAQTAEVLAFVARRLEGEPIALVAGGPLGDAELPRIALAPLADRDAFALLDARAEGLSPLARERIVYEARGNPLALVELAARLSGEDDAELIGADVPLSPALAAAFAPGLDDLPAATRALLLVAALNDADDLAETVRAASLRAGDVVTTGAPGADALGPAVAAALVTVASGRISFRHRLTRTAVRQAASDAERRAAHRALGTVVAGDPDRAAWHRACATDGRDEALAGALEAAAGRARARGDLGATAARLRRAGLVSEDATARARRQVGAAELVLALGGRALATRQVAEIVMPRDAPAVRCRIATLRERLSPRIAPGSFSIRAHAELAMAAGREGAVDEALMLLWTVAGASIAADAPARLRDPLLAAVRAVSAHRPHPAALATLGILGLVEHGPEIREGLAAHLEPDPDPDRAYLLGSAALAIGAVADAELHLTTAIAGMRAQRRVHDRADALAMLAFIAADSGLQPQARAHGEEALALAAESGRMMALTIAHCALALAAGARGDDEAVNDHAAVASRIAFPARATIVLARVQQARGLAALAAHRPAEAYHHLIRVDDPHDPAYDRATRLALIGDLAEAAVAVGQADEARALLAEVDLPPGREIGDRATLACRHAHLVLAPEDELDAAADAAFALARRPFHRARMQLVHGMRLRRARRVADSREPLREAQATFAELGATPWAERARQELAATAESSHRGADVTDRLTPRELEIARLAAQGLSNRAIGERLALSPRTVGSHLARIFPKLDVGSRAEIAGALDAAPLLGNKI